MSKVRLYVYDLSRGMAKSMSMMLTGKQIDGIWHTSVVAYGREIFFGQGILEARPGTTHHGQPLQIIDCGTTEIDEATFQEYISSLQEMYTPEAYHLIEFNCNHFTADVVGFLTGATIPSWISGLPAEFLSTPFGQAMKPQIDSMFRRTTSAEHPVTSPSGSRPPATLPTPPTSGTSTPAFGSSLLSSVAAQATAQPPTPARTPPTAETSPLTLVTSSSNFSSILQQHPAVVVNFTNTPSCPPCRAIKPVYESIAAEHASTYGVKGARFVEVELSIGEGNQIASSYGVRATPTFIFFKDGKKVDEMKGAAKRELEGKVEEFLESIWPRHPHRKIYMPLIEKIPINPITSTATPNYPALLKKLESLGAVKSDVDVLRDQVVPLLEGKQTSSDRSVQAALASWCPSTVNMANSLDPSSLFPLVDLWRVGVSNPVIAAALALDLSADSTENRAGDSAVGQLLAIVAATLKKQGADTPKPLLLTALRLITNILAALPLTNLLLSRSSSPRLYSVQQDLLSITVESLLHTEVTVRSAAAGVAVNMASWRHRIAKETRTVPEDEPEADWEVELVSALVEGVGRESDEDVAHRLLVALALTIYLSPGYLESLRSLLEVLDAKGIIESRMKGWKKAEVRKLATEMTSKLMR